MLFCCWDYYHPSKRINKFFNMITSTLSKLWEIYIDQNPNARKVFNLFSERGETVINDHIALRTFDLPKVNINKLAAVFRKDGYEMKGEYLFPDKHLYARHYEHADAGLPKIFISQLELDTFSDEFKNIVSTIVGKINQEIIDSDSFIHSGVVWGDISFQTYNLLRKESEYAAWLYANGFVANHFTVSVNHLKSFSNLLEVNSFLKENGFLLNANPNEIQGSKEQFLEQSSIKAGLIEVKFIEGIKQIPSCYYEFALRYPMHDGKIFDAFIADSANKIFESTDFYKE